MKGNNLSDVKKANRQVVYECIWSHKAVTMTDIAYMTHLSRPTVTSLVQEMTAWWLKAVTAHPTAAEIPCFTTQMLVRPMPWESTWSFRKCVWLSAIWNVRISAFPSVSIPGTQIKTR